ncbi:MAG: CHAT domain-containing protein, partial [Chitinophagaceae bacterium]|nr:CHAT domain-containing protein [Chitinophagaceae bacterium]
KKVLGSEHPDYAKSLNGLALLYKSMGNYSKAEPMYLEAMNVRKKVLGTEHPDYANSLNNLAFLYDEMGNYSKAEPMYLEALNVLKKVLGSEHPEYASSLNNLAILYDKMGNYGKAEPLYAEALNIRKKVLGTKHPYYAQSLNNLAFLYKSMGNYGKAEPLYVEAMNIRKEVLGAEHPDYAQSLNNLASLYDEIGNYGKAEPYLIKGSAIKFNHLLANFTNLSEKEKQIWLDVVDDVNELILSFQHHYPSLSDTARRFILNQQLLLKSLILSDSKDILQNIQINKDSSLQKIYSDWTETKKQLSVQYSLPVTKRSIELSNLEQQAEDLEKQLNTKSSAFRQQQQSLRIKIIDVQKGLRQDEATVEFVRFRLYNKKWTDSIIYAAYILKKGDVIPLFVPLFVEKQLEQLLAGAGKTSTSTARILYQSQGGEGKKNSLGKKVYDLVWKPLEPFLKDVQSVSYSPAGKLYGIAFHALPVDDKNLLMDKYELNQYISTRQVALRNIEEQNSKPENIILFGNANFSMDSLQLVKQRKIEPTFSSSFYTPSTRGSGIGLWPNLPGSAEEIKTIKKLFDQNGVSTRVYTQTDASEDNLKALDGISPQVLHLATHGFFLPEPDNQTKKKETIGGQNTYKLAEDPLLRSGLIFSGGNYAWSGKTPIEGVEDGIATAYEIAQLNLSNTELVVMSACETALGDIKGSEGVYGLQRAFKLAGVKKMIASLWKVPDKETAELMTDFYGYWMKGQTINEAFTHAQAEMRKKYPPFYWAAFVLVE